MYLFTSKSLQVNLCKVRMWADMWATKQQHGAANGGLRWEREDLLSGSALPVTDRVCLQVANCSVFIWFWGRPCLFASRAVSIRWPCPLSQTFTAIHFKAKAFKKIVFS